MMKDAKSGGARDAQRDLEILRRVARRIVLERQFDRLVGSVRTQWQAGEKRESQETAA